MFTRKQTFRNLLCRFIFIAFTLALTLSVHAQDLVWAKRAGGGDDVKSMGDGDAAFAIAVLPDGSALITGTFIGTATFGAGESGETVLTSAYWYDIFVAKYNPDGTLAWAKKAGGISGNYGNGIVALPDGSAVVTGSFNGTTTFGAGESGETTLTSVFAKDIFVAKYNPDGTLAWAKGAGGSGTEQGRDIAALADGSVLVTGEFGGSATFGADEAGETTLTSADDEDIFIAKYNTDGTLAWAKRAGGTGSDYGYGIAALNDQSSLVTGYFWDTATFGPGEPGETTFTSGRLFVAKYNPNGTLAWVKRAEGNARGLDIAALSDGSALVTGYYNFGATFGPGESGEVTLPWKVAKDIFVARYNPDGTLAWAKRAGDGLSSEARAIAALSDGSALVTGLFSGTATFGEGESSETALTSAGWHDIFVAKYNPEGTLAWVTRAGGNDPEDSGYGIAVDHGGFALVVGQFFGTAVFGEDESAETTLTSAGWYDIFIAKYTGAHPARAHSYWSLYY